MSLIRNWSSLSWRGFCATPEIIPAISRFKFLSNLPLLLAALKMPLRIEWANFYFL